MNNFICPHCQKEIEMGLFASHLGKLRTGVIERKSSLKAKSCRANGKKGGRPRNQPKEIK